MSDPVAEAAANLAKQSDPSLLEKAMDTIHDLEAKVEHLIHPETEAGSAEEGKPSPTGTPDDSTPSPAAPVVSGTDAHVISSPTVDVGNVVAAAGDGVPEVGAAPADGGELPNAVSGAAESTTGTDSAPSVSGSGETSSTVANSVEQPLHVRIATHLEAIYRLAESAPTAAVADTSALKSHVGDILHRISNGMQVTEGELVQKLEALYRML